MSKTENSVKVVVFKRFKYIPNLVPFAVKVETFMRLANIKYDVECANDFSGNKETGKLPYAIINGVQVSDSQNIIRRLSELFDVDLDLKLTPVEKAISHSFQRMLDEFTYWTYVHWRYVVHPEAFWKPDIMDGVEAFGVNRDDVDRTQKAIEAGKKLVTQCTYSQGVGRKPSEEICKMGIEDLKALSLYLGEKPFIFGDKPSTVDCVLFGHLCQIVYLPLQTLPQKIAVENECKNLVEFCDRMKALAWPDWDTLTK